MSTSKSRSGFLLLLLLAAFLMVMARPALAVIFHATGDPAYNTNAPTGALANSGWQYTGRWGGFLGTVIAPRYFVTAKHIAADDTGAGDPFVFQGQSYTALTYYDDPNSDLRLWRVCGAFPPPYAPLYTLGVEVNRGVVLIGRGTQRGAEVRGGLTNGLRGWEWGAYDGVQRWGSNTVAGVINGGTELGSLISLRFNAGAGPDEAHLSYGDSGGPIFVMDVTTWKLAGVNHASDGRYSHTTNDAPPGFYAALFDESDLFKRVNQVWVPGTLTPGNSYATRIASRVIWINSILNQVPPADPPPVLQSAAGMDDAFADDPAAVVNVPTRTVTVPISGPQRFFRLRACASHRITAIAFDGPNVVVTYE